MRHRPLTRPVALGAAVAVVLALVPWAAAAQADASGWNDVRSLAVGGAPEAMAVDAATHTGYVAQNGANALAVVDLASGTVTGTVPVGGGPDGVALDAADHLAYVTNALGDDSVSIVDLTTLTVTRTVPLSGGEPTGVVVDPATGDAFVADDNGIDEITPAGTLTYLDLQQSPYGIAIDPATRTVYAALPGADAVAVVDAATLTAKPPLTAGLHSPYYLDVDTSTGDLDVANGTVNEIDVLDPQTNTTTASIPLPQSPSSVAVDPVAHRAYVGYFGSGVYVLGTTTHTVLGDAALPGDPYGTAVDTGTGLGYALDGDGGPGGDGSVEVIGQGAAVGTSPTQPTATATTVTVTAAPTPTVGTPTTLTATVGPTPDGGTVAFSGSAGPLDGCSTVPVDTAAGTATCVTTFGTGGNQAVTAAYSGTPAFAASTGTATFALPDPGAQIAGSTGSCTTTSGAVVAVDFGPFGGPVVRGCDPQPTTGIALLDDSGFTTAGDQHDGPEFLCRIGSAAYAGGTQYPTPAQDPCIQTPPASAYWSYWIAPAGQDSWTYSPLGAYADRPGAGEVEAWVYGGTDIAGTTGQPTFSPAQVRATATATTPGGGTGSGTGTGTSSGSGSGTGAGAGPQLTKAVHYLTTTTGANGVAGGSTLAGSGFYDAANAPGSAHFADVGLTIDGAFALAATGLDDATLATVTRFVDRGTDGSGRTTAAYTGIGTAYASGGSIAKVAVLAEVTGNDPRTFTGHDLIAALDKTDCAAATPTGCAAAGNYAYAASTFGQALGVIAQLRAGDATAAAAPIRYLESLQHADGAFGSLIPDAGDDDVDSTAIAAMALDLVATDPAASAADKATAAAAVTKAVAEIAATQLPDGGWHGTAGDSTNSAALALQGLHLAGATDAAQIAKGTAFLLTQQNGDGGFAVAADPGSQRGSDVRATTQVVGGLVGTSFGTLRDDITALPATPTAPGGTTAPSLPGMPLTPTSPAHPGTVGGAGTSPGDTGTTSDGIENGTTADGALPFTGWDADLGLQIAGELLLTGAGALVAVRARRRRRAGSR